MTQKEKINWQFAPEYYKFLLEMQKSIRESYHLEDYETAFKDMEQIFMQIHEEIKKDDKIKSMYTVIESKIEAINKLNLELNLTEIDSQIPDEHKLLKMSEIKHKQKAQVSSLYKDLTKVISDLGMLFPKIQVDTRLPIFQR
jgi:hypothetical protein